MVKLKHWCDDLSSKMSTALHF